MVNTKEVKTKDKRSMLASFSRELS